MHSTLAVPCLAQFLDFSGFYDREKLFWKDIVDTLMFIGAAPPGGGRSAITPRCTRHCNVLCMPSASDAICGLIFSNIYSGFLKVASNPPTLIPHPTPS